MFLTFYYAYATMMQWWRLRSLRDKLNGTLNAHNALLVCCGGVAKDTRKQRSVENLLFRYDNKIGCTVVPKQRINLNQWIAFPKNPRHFPIHIEQSPTVSVGVNPVIFVLIQAALDNFYVKHQSEIIQVESFGELIGWKASDGFEVILKTDIENLTKLILKFSRNDVDINHELQLSKIETVNVEGAPNSIKYDKKYLKEQTLRYSYSPVDWSKFVGEVRDLYSKIRDVTNPRIKIENGSPKPPESKPPTAVKKSKEVKNTLDVASGGHGRHKSQPTNKKPPVDKKKEEPGAKSVKAKQKTKTVDADKKKEHKKIGAIGKSKEVVENDTSPKKVEELPSTSSSNGAVAKPPNVLVYADSVVTKDSVKRVLYSILNKEKYLIYDLPTSINASKSPVWNKSTVLVVVCGGVPPELTSQLIQYFLSGGKMLCLCSDLMYSVLYTFTTAEVREHELVRFSYGSWQRVKMMHHIFCYQASPAKKQFSKDSDHSNHSSSNGSSPLAPRTPSNVELRHNERDYNIQVQVLGTEETWQTPSLLLAKVKGGDGSAIFSQVHLEIDPDQYEHEDEDKYESLRSSNAARLEIFRDILEKQLEMVCDDSATNVTFTPGYFLGRFDVKMSLLSDCDSITNNQLTCNKICAIFYKNNVDLGEATNIRLPVMINSCPQNFSTVDYFDVLSSREIGRLVIYSDVMTSTHNLLSKTLRHGLCVIAKQQTNGMGRADNSWLSPPGCAMFSLQLHLSLDSNLGQFLSLVQHLVMTSVVTAVKNAGLDCLSLGIKWPNDLYADGSVKIGGLIAHSTIQSKCAIVNIGCGVNLSNRNPTICINELIERHNRTSGGPDLKLLSYERFFALVFNEIEILMDLVEREGVESFFELYYEHWLHSDADVTIQDGAGCTTKAKVMGVDNYGFLMVRTLTGDVVTVQPDGNTFDMMKGLISPKIF